MSTFKGSNTLSNKYLIIYYYVCCCYFPLTVQYSLKNNEKLSLGPLKRCPHPLSRVDCSIKVTFKNSIYIMKFSGLCHMTA